MWNIILGGLFIASGLSGHYALRGTDSPLGLVLVGAGLVLWGLIRLGSGPGREPRRRVRRGPRGMRTVGAGSPRVRVRR